jgi:flagellar protein FlaG
MTPDRISQSLNRSAPEPAASRRAVRPQDGTPGSAPVPADPAPLPPAPSSQQQRDALNAVAEANRKLAEKGSELTIEFEDSLGRMIFKLVDKQTGEVVRRIPSEEALAVARALAGDDRQGVLVRSDA